MNWEDSKACSPLKQDILRAWFAQESRYCLEQEGHDLLAAIPDALKKDGGWEPAIVSMLLNSFNLDDPNVLFIKKLEPKDLQAFVLRLRLAIADLALP